MQSKVQVKKKLIKILQRKVTIDACCNVIWKHLMLASAVEGYGLWVASDMH